MLPPPSNLISRSLQHVLLKKHQQPWLSHSSGHVHTVPDLPCPVPISLDLPGLAAWAKEQSSSWVLSHPCIPTSKATYPNLQGGSFRPSRTTTCLLSMHSTASAQASETGVRSTGHPVCTPGCPHLPQPPLPRPQVLAIGEVGGGPRALGKPCP